MSNNAVKFRKMEYNYFFIQKLLIQLRIKKIIIKKNEMRENFCIIEVDFIKLFYRGNINKLTINCVKNLP